MVIGHHLIWTAYGWWLPNDPRGSCPCEFRAPRIAQLGQIHYGRKAKQPPRSDLRAFSRQAGQVLAHGVLSFDADDVRILAASIARTIDERGYVCHACAIMPEHVHLLIRRHTDWAEDMLAYFQEATRRAIIEAGKRPGNHPVWGGRGWKGFRSSWGGMVSTARYIEGNPGERDLPAQLWEFVQPIGDF